MLATYKENYQPFSKVKSVQVAFCLFTIVLYCDGYIYSHSFRQLSLVFSS